MFAILDHNGKQFKVQEGDTIRLDNVGKMKEIVFEDILIFNNKDGETIIGSPFVSSVRIIGKVLENLKDKKIVVFKKKRRHNYRRKIGHRQDLTLIKIEEVKLTNTSNNKSVSPNLKTEDRAMSKGDSNGS